MTYCDKNRGLYSCTVGCPQCEAETKRRNDALTVFHETVHMPARAEAGFLKMVLERVGGPATGGTEIVWNQTKPEFLGYNLPDHMESYVRRSTRRILVGGTQYTYDAAGSWRPSDEDVKLASEWLAKWGAKYKEYVGS